MSNAKAIKDAYDDSLLEIQKVLFSQEATPEQKEVARQSLKGLTTALLLHNLHTIEGRAAILSALIVELQEVIHSVQIENPLNEIASDLTVVVTRAKDLFKEEKEQIG